jgi:hypothetical protein
LIETFGRDSPVPVDRFDNTQISPAAVNVRFDNGALGVFSCPILPRQTGELGSQGCRGKASRLR